MDMKHTRHWLTMVVWLLCGITASAHDFEVDGIYYNITSSTDLKVEVTFRGVDYDEYIGEYSGTVTIPSTVTYEGSIYNVTNIGYSAFSDCSTLIVIAIPEGVTNIGDYAFHNCGGLTSITIPEGVTSIGESAFGGCSNLIISLPESITSIGYAAFGACERLTSIILPKGVTSIEPSVFYYCINLTSITIPESVTSIGGSAFEGCGGLTSITIPEGVTSIGSRAFYNCNNLTSITCKAINPPTCESMAFNNIPQSISVYVPSSSVLAYQTANEWNNFTNIRTFIAFGNCGDKLTWTLTDGSELIIEGTGEMTNYSFEDNAPWYIYPLIKNITIRNGVNTIGSYAFYYCADLTSVIIPESVTDIGHHAFYNCMNLTSVILPEGVTSICNHVFCNCNSLTSIALPQSVTSIEDYAFHGCRNLTSITIPESVTTIGNEAFSYCDNLSSIISKATIPPTCEVTAFSNVNKSIPIYVHSSSISTYQASDVWNDFTNMHSFIASGSCGDKLIWTLTDDGRLIVEGSGVMPNYYSGDNAPWYDYRSSIENVIIREGVISVGAGNFRGCDNLITVTIPCSATSIGYEAFAECSKLTSIALPENIANIGSYAFEGCSSLASITIPESVTSIGEYGAFSHCSSLTTITIPNGVAEIGDNTFNHCTNLASITIPQSATRIGEFAFSSCSSLTSITIPESVTNIGKSAFDNCSSLTSIIIPQSVTRIGGRAFLGCNSLISIVVEEGNAIYDSRDGCNAIIETSTNTLIEGCNATVIPNSVTSIGNSAFSGNSLVSFIIPEGVTSIGSDAFFNCKNLASITIPKSLNYINHFAFSGCNSLTSIAFPKSQKSVGNYTFSGCSSLASIVIPEEVVSIGNSAFAHCSSLTSITIPESVTNIYGYAFYNCTGLASIISKAATPPACSDDTSFGFIDKSIPVYVPASSVAAYQAADGWSEFTNIRSYIASGTCGDNLTWILTDEGELIIEGTGAMADYDRENTTPWHDYKSSIKNVSIKEGVISIGDYAFHECSKSTSITIPESVTSIGDYAFCQCCSLASITIPDGVTRIGEQAFYMCYCLTSITIPESVTSIGECAFVGCSSLTSITIPESVTSIGYAAFFGCSSLTSIVVAEGNVHYDSRNGCNAIIETSSNTLIAGCSSTTIPESVTSIGNDAFWGCDNLTSITIPDGVTSIGSDAFSNCHSLTSVTVENPVPVALTDGDVFSNRANATLYVPAGSKETYASAAVWSEFKEIVEVGNAFVVDDATLRAGRSALLPVALTNENETTAFQCDIYLPEGITLLMTDRGKYDITLAEERKDDHTVSSSLQNDGAIRVVVASLTSSLFAGNSGNLFYLNLQADEDISGELPLSIKNIRISESDGTRHDLNDASCVINVPLFTPADVNNDGMVAIDDVVLTINYLLGNVSDNFLFVAADMNADNEILIDDVVQVINCLLGVSTADVQAARNRVRETGETLEAGDTQCGFDVKLSNASDYVALQCDVLLPAGVGIDDIRVTSGSDHSVVFREMSDGAVRIAVTSLTNEAFASDNLLDVAVSADRQADIHITNAYAVTRGGVMVKAADASLTHGTTGIQPAGMEAISTEIYDLNGRVVKENATSTEGLQKGIYLMNGKKIVVK